MMKSKPLSNEDYIKLLEEQRYDEILLTCKDYIQERVDAYLRNFHYYKQFNGDFYHEVYIHILTKSLPSPAFLKACQNGNSFKFYLAKSVRNLLNTLLSKEKHKRDRVVTIESLYPNTEEEFDTDKSAFLSDKSLKEQMDSRISYQQIKDKFKYFLDKFVSTFPRVGPKLKLLLKLQARVAISEQDLQPCFKGISRRDIKNFLEALGQDEVYRQREDKEIYQIIQPFFKSYRQEKGSPAALQRWLNQHITGDKFSQGILDKLTIKDQSQTFKISDKKIFSDFLHVYFTEETERELSVLEESAESPVITFGELKPSWIAALSR